MHKHLFRTLPALALLCVSLTAVSFAQDFQKTYRLGAGSSVAVHNISGNVKVTGYNGDAIVVTAWKEGRDRDMVEVKDNSTATGVNVRAVYPERCNCNASVRFEVQVPRSINYQFEDISSVSGDVEVTGVTGKLRAKSVSGEVSVNHVTGSVNAHSVSGDVAVGNVAGTVNAKSTSGNVGVSISKLDNSDDLSFASVSGNVEVRLPANLDARIDLSTMSGSLRTDFPVTIEEARYGPGRHARGSIGSGTRSLKASSTSGNVSLIRN